MRDTLKRLRQRIENNDALNQDDQQTLLGLIGELESDADELQQHPACERVLQAIDAADSAPSEDSDDDSGPLESLQNAIREVEASHPRVAETLARIGNILGRMGI
jgi:hypothetical protein